MSDTHVTDRTPGRPSRSSAGDDAGTAAPPVVRRRRTEPATPARRWPKRLLLGAVGVVGIVALTVAAGAAWGVWSINRVAREDVKLASVEDNKPRNFLVIGSDSRAGVDRKSKGANVMLGHDTPGGQRSDSISIMRIDPGRQRVDMLSIPRDLWVPIAGTGGEQRINTAYGRSTQTLIDTIQQDLGIPINHFVSVDLAGFQKVINAIGGVPMYFPNPVKDANSGLTVPKRGCTVLDGYMGLAFARSRHLVWGDGVKWHSDPTGDIGRMTRQQLLVRTALGKVKDLGLNDVTSIKRLVDATVDSLTLDSSMGAGDIIDLAQRFSHFDPDHLQTHSLPATPHTTSGGAQVLLLDSDAAQPVLDIFRGSSATAAAAVTTTTLPPPEPHDVTVDVENATPKQGEARRVSYVLAAAGFGNGAVTSAKGSEVRTVIRFPRGGRSMAELVGTWLDPTPQIEEDPSLSPGHVAVTIGADFAHVSKPSAPSAGGAGQQVDRTPAGAATPSTQTTTTTTEPGWSPGVAPAGITCR